MWHGGVGCNDIMPIFGLGIRKLTHIIAMDTNKKYAVGVDIGGSHITSAVVDLETDRLSASP